MIGHFYYDHGIEKEDARKLSPEQQKEKRKIALRMRMNGREFSEIGETVGVHPRTVQYWWSRYQAEGLKSAIDGGERGTGVGEHRTLSIKQEWVIQQLISEKMPDQLKLSLALWTRAAVKVRGSMMKIQNQPKRVISYFSNRKIQYAV